MSVSEVKLSSIGSNGSFNAGDSTTIPLGGSYRAHYRVKCDSASDTPDIVMLHFRRTTSLPWIGRSFRFGNGWDRMSLCRSVEANYIEGSGGWFTAEARFEPLAIQDTEHPDPATGENTADPFRWHDEIDVFYTQYAKPVEQAKFLGWSNGAANRHMPSGATLPITNSSRIPLDPPLEEEVDIQIIRIAKIFPRYSDNGGFGGLENYNGAINSDLVTINKPLYGFRKSIKPHQGRIKVIGASFNIENGIKFWRNTIEVHVHPETWLRDVLDRGFEELYYLGETVTETGESISTTNAPLGHKHIPIKVGETRPATPQLLNGRGKKLKPNEPAVYGRWQTKKVVPFAGIRW